VLTCGKDIETVLWIILHRLSKLVHINHFQFEHCSLAIDIEKLVGREPNIVDSKVEKGSRSELLWHYQVLTQSVRKIIKMTNRKYSAKIWEKYSQNLVKFSLTKLLAKFKDSIVIKGKMCQKYMKNRFRYHYQNCHCNMVKVFLIVDRIVNQKSFQYLYYDDNIWPKSISKVLKSVRTLCRHICEKYWKVILYEFD